MKLNELFSGLPKTKGRKILGRGLGCGKGKTSGRGHKGQKARAGCSVKGFEGGQQSIFTRLPKRGFRSFSRKKCEVINLGSIQKLIDAGKIDSGTDVSKETLMKLGIVAPRNRIKILGKGELKVRVGIYHDSMSRSAKGKVFLPDG